MSLHPTIVHFPIALLLTSIIFDIVSVLRPRPTFQELALYLLILGVVGAIAAGVSGDRAGEAVAHLPALRPAVEQHADFATGTIWLFILLLLARLYLLIKGRFVSGLRTAYLVISLIAGGLLATTSYLGGRLVYEHGVGVRPAVEQTSPVGK